MSKWQDISTAPKDGTYILAFDADSLWQGGEENPHIVSWENSLPDGRFRIQLDGQTCHPTHWMPLPSPPQAQGESEEERSDDTAITEERIASLTQQLDSLRASLANEKEAREKADALAAFFETELSRILQEGQRK